MVNSNVLSHYQVTRVDPLLQNYCKTDGRALRLRAIPCFPIFDTEPT